MGYLIVALAIMLFERFYYGIRWGRGNKRGGVHCMDCKWDGLGNLFASLDVLLAYLKSIA